MSHKLRLLPIMLLSLIFITACQETMIVIPEIQVPVTDRTVLIEDLTGVQCPNCPRGTAEIERILSVYGDKVNVVAIHGVLQADPLKESKYDFRNKFAEDLENFFAGFLGKPSASVNRTLFEGENELATISVELWAKYVQEILEKENELTLLLDKNYDATTRRLDLEATILPLINQTGNYRVSVYVTESEIEDVQEGVGVIIEDYEHNHVLRHMLTKFDGDNLGTELKEGDNIKKNYTYTIPDEFNDEHIEVVVSIHRNEANDKSIIQSAAVKLK